MPRRLIVNQCKALMFVVVLVVVVVVVWIVFCLFLCRDIAGNLRFSVVLVLR